MLRKIFDWLEQRAEERRQDDFDEGFAHAAMRILRGYANEKDFEGFYSGDDDYDKGVSEAVNLIIAMQADAALLTQKVQEVSAYKILYEKIQDDLAESLEMFANIKAASAPNIEPSLNAIIANNTLPDWPQIWAAQDEDGGWWIYRNKPLKTYVKADQSGGFVPEVEGSKRLTPPLRRFINWKQSPERIK